MGRGNNVLQALAQSLGLALPVHLVLAACELSRLSLPKLLRRTYLSLSCSLANYRQSIIRKRCHAERGSFRARSVMYSLSDSGQCHFYWYLFLFGIRVKVQVLWHLRTYLPRLQVLSSRHISHVLYTCPSAHDKNVYRTSVTSSLQSLSSPKYI